MRNLAWQTTTSTTGGTRRSTFAGWCVLTGQLWRLPPERIEALMLGLIETAAAAREMLEALERRDRDDERPAVH